GMPKSGTSSLFYWLDEHPLIQGASPKETFFFMDDSHPLSGRHGLSFGRNGVESYSSFFPDRKEDSLLIEATTHYFYQRTARDYLSSLQKKPLIVMLLREPANRILSSFRFTRDNLAY